MIPIHLYTNILAFIIALDQFKAHCTDVSGRHCQKWDVWYLNGIDFTSKGGFTKDALFSGIVGSVVHWSISASAASIWIFLVNCPIFDVSGH